MLSSYLRTMVVSFYLKEQKIFIGIIENEFDSKPMIVNIILVRTSFVLIAAEIKLS